MGFYVSHEAAEIDGGVAQCEKAVLWHQITRKEEGLYYGIKLPGIRNLQRRDEDNSWCAFLHSSRGIHWGQREALSVRRVSEIPPGVPIRASS